MQQKKRITLLIPDLFSSLKFRDKPLHLPNLARILSKSNSQVLPKIQNALAYLTDRCGLADLDYQSQAALHQYSVGEEVKSWVCYASPVLLRPNRNHLAIERASGFEFDKDEGNALCIEFNEYFKENGLVFSYRDPDIIFCQSQQAINVANISPSDIIGENIMGHLPSGKAEMQLRNLFNESQMLLHHSATNRHRVEKGKPDVNSLWFWGGGGLPPLYSSPYKSTFTNAPEVAGFAKLGQSDTNVLPSTLSAELFSSNGEYLIYLDFQIDRDAILLAENYAETSIQLLKNKTIDEIIVVPDHGKQFNVTANSLKKFWKRQQNIQTFF